MSFTTRSLDEISRSVRGAIRQYLPGTDASLRQNVLYVIGKVMTLLAREYELRLEWIFRQLFLRTATSEAIVRLHAADFGMSAKPEAAAAGMIAGTAAANLTYPAGIRFFSGGTSYVTTAAFTANAVGAFSAAVAAETAGAATNREAGAILLLADPVLWPEIGQEATVAAGGLGGGADRETIEELRSRALKRKATPPQGGALPDYELWAREVPGVTQAWAAQFENGIGSIGAWVLFAGRPNGIPTEADLAAVAAHIADKRIVRGEFAAVAPQPVPVDLTISLSPDTAALRTAVTLSLAAFFDAAAEGSRIRPGLPGDPFVLPRAWISETISATLGEFSHVLVAPDFDPVFSAGQLPVPGTISWA